ncbi:uncharacterized protein LOC108666557 [Hyalella azteca]|uniref:Uncharacterized protein LOC108666557 n=1 Tax=Hyalella azteca TaxID=294128 RepID=A0A979FPQ9_HYAAZ|nr:uncharacterized protein LOC108666557 [Hyalella azteca]
MSSNTDKSKLSLDECNRQVIEILVDPPETRPPHPLQTNDVAARGSPEQDYETIKSIKIDDNCSIESHPGDDLGPCNTIEFTSTDCNTFEPDGDVDAGQGYLIHHHASGSEEHSGTARLRKVIQTVYLKKVPKPHKGNQVNGIKHKKASGSSKKRFCPSWFNIPEIAPWLEESTLPNHAYCKFCQKDLTAGKSELYKHMNTSKHQRKAEHYGFAPPIKREPHDGMNDVLEVDFDLSRDDDSKLSPVQGNAERPPPVPSRLPALRKYEVYLADDMHVASTPAMLEVAHNVNKDPCTTGRVRELEKRVAQLLDKEDAMFVLTGSMANCLAVLAHCPISGSLVMAGDRSHLYRRCQTSLTRLGQVNLRVLRNTDDGRVNLDEVCSLMLDEGDAVQPSLLCLENTHTFCGGQVLPELFMQQAGKVCRDFGLKLHVDGARLLHAAFACDLSPSLLAAQAHSVTLCFNKGLAAHNGSVVAGSKDFIDRCRQISDVFCTSSVKLEALAATCLRALANYVHHIAKTQLHARNIYRSRYCARNIYRSLSRLNTTAITLVPSNLHTNVIILECDGVRVTPQHLTERLRLIPAHEVKELAERTTVVAKVRSYNTVRLMTHPGLGQAQVAAAIKKLKFVMEEYDNYLVLECDMPEE